MKNLHIQKNLVCLSTDEFNQHIKYVESVEKELASAKERILLLEHTLRNTENELKSVLSKQAADELVVEAQELGLYGDVK
jgi:predicted ABC-type ATPase